MAKKKKSTLLTRLFGNRNKVTDFMTEEQLQSPGPSDPQEFPA